MAQSIRSALARLMVLTAGEPAILHADSPPSVGA